ncbi:MAG TPA: FHA domain-containing protein [Candidatus Gordonibacter avicola]|nr:FHA domain-containing protein [Candidatus Gordonibacter avicola]
MGFLSRFEGKMEDTLEGAADRMFDAPISPVQIAKKAEKQMRRGKMVGAGKQYAPTLYTVLVNPDDDQRLFGYYPTLAGETETYLAAKAADEGLVMDGQPLVRFIVDEELKHGKFDIIAEPVAAPIIAQLRAEEMQRYGLGGAAPVPAGGQAAPYGAPAGGYAAAPAPAPAPAPVPEPVPSRAPAPQAQPYGHGQPAPAADPYAPSDPYAAPAAYPAAASPAPMPQPYQDLDAGFTGYDDFNAYDQGAKPPLPYVPEDEIDYSIDYGEYTFDSQDFQDYRENGRSQARPVPAPDSPAAAAGFAGGAAAGAAAAAAAAAAYAAHPAAGAPVAADTVVFAGGGQATPVPNQQAVRASLIDTTNNRTYTLAASRLLMGRESKNDIVVDDINASRTHAELRFEPQGVWTITDLGSTNGTFVNGAEIATSPLREGDRITIGMTNFVFTQAQ